MKILLIASKSEFTDQVIRAFEKNSIEVLYLDDRKNYLFPKLFQNVSFFWQLTRRFGYLKDLSNQELNKKVIELCEKFKPDLVFIIKGMVIKESTLAKLHQMGIKTANWFLENLFIEPYKTWLPKNYGNFDYFFTCNSQELDYFPSTSKTKVIYLPVGVDPSYYELDELTEEDRKRYSCDVCFVGASYPERVEAMEYIKDLNLKIFGWEGWRKTELKSLYFGVLNTKEMAKLFNCAKISINMAIQPPLHTANLRTFEIPAAGGFGLMDYRKDMDGLFKVGEEFAIFSDKKDLREKILFYLGNDKLRRSIVEAGHQKVLQEHTLEKRVKFMLDFL